MLRLDRVGQIVTVPLAVSAEGLDSEAAAVLAEINAPYVGVMVKVRLVDRVQAMAFSDRARRFYLESQAAPDAVTMERAREMREEMVAQVAAMCVGLIGVEIGGIDLSSMEGAELARAVSEAHMTRLLGDVAAACRNAQQPSRAAKNSSASSPSPSADASSTSGA